MTGVRGRLIRVEGVSAGGRRTRRNSSIFFKNFDSDAKIDVAREE